MENVLTADLAKRCEQNPLLTPKDMKPSEKGMTVKCLLNPSVFKHDKKTWLLIPVGECSEQAEDSVRVSLYKDGEIETVQFDKTDPHLNFEDPRVIRHKNKEYPTTLSHFRLMCSDDGTLFYEAEGYDPIFAKGPLETHGITDCRVTEMNGMFFLTYTMISSYGAGIGLMQTRDWKHFDRKGMILPPHNKDCVIFEEKIKDKYFALHRPTSPHTGGNHIWLSESSDLAHWGHHKCIATTRENMWDSARVGAGASPIRTPKGWLVIYHGADENHRYCLGALLLDIRDPWQVIARSEAPIMEPTEEYELNGFSGNGIVTNGHLVIGDKLRIYYGACNQVICRADLSIHEILDSLSLKK
jgi:predicted GH43/DUF377 family glycosyl hydrolase